MNQSENPTLGEQEQVSDRPQVLSESDVQSATGMFPILGEPAADLDARMVAAGMIPLSQMLVGGGPLDRFSANIGVQDHAGFGRWLEMKTDQYMRMRLAYELDDQPKDDLYEWVFAHAAVFRQILDNWRAMNARMAAGGHSVPASGPAT